MKIQVQLGPMVLPWIEIDQEQHETIKRALLPMYKSEGIQASGPEFLHLSGPSPDNGGKIMAFHINISQISFIVVMDESLTPRKPVLIATGFPQ